MALSATNQKIIANKRAAEQGRGLLMPELGVSNSTPETSEFGFNPYKDIPKMIVQGTARGTFATGQAIGGALLGLSPDELAQHKYTPQGGSKFVFGEADVSTESEGTDFVKMLGADEEYANELGVIAIAGFTALDVLTGGSARTVSTALKNADNLADVAKTMRSVGFEDDIIKNYGDFFVGAKTEKEVGEGLEAAIKFQESTKRVQTTPLRAVDGADVITLGGKVMSDEVVSIRKDLIKILDEVGDEVTTKVKEDLSRTTVPTMRQVDIAVETLKNFDAVPPSLTARVEDIRSTIKAEPSRFLDEPDTPTTVVKRNEVDDSQIESLTVPDRFAPGKTETFTVGNHISYESLGGSGDEILAEGRLVGINEKGELLVASKGTMDFEAGPITRSLQHENEIVVLKTDDVFSNKTPDEIKVKDGEMDAYFAKKNAEADLKNAKALPAKLDEVANPVKEDFGRVVADVQARYGKGTVRKSQVQKFKQHEQKVFHELLRYSEEATYVAENGGEMIQSMPKWVPDNLRYPHLFTNLTDILRNGDAPVVHGSPEMELYLSLVDEVAKRSGVKNKGLKPAIDPASAVLQRHRERTAVPGSPVVKLEPGISTRKVARIKESEANMFEGADPMDEYADHMAFLDSQRDINSFTPSNKDRSFVETLNFSETHVKDLDKDILTHYELPERVWGEQWPIVKENIYDKFDAAKGRMVADEARLTKELSENITKGLGIHRKSPESAMIQLLGEGHITYEQVVAKVGKATADKIVQAHDWMRGFYDKVIVEINLTRPADNQIANRPDYFRHFDELSGMGALKDAFEDVGLGNFTTGESFLQKLKNRAKSFTKKRTGEKTTYDAVGGILNYIPQYAFEKNMRHEIGRINAFVKDLEAAGAGEKLPGYIKKLREFSDELNGGFNQIDLWATQRFSSGMKVLNEINYFNNKVKRNAVLGNFGSAIVQYGNMPQVMAEAGVYIAPGMKRTLSDLGDLDNAKWKQGTFLPERFKHELYSEFAVGIAEKGITKAGHMIAALDKVSSILAWNSFYEKAAARGIKDPMKYADDMTRKMVGGRGIGEVSPLQKSKVIQIIAPFTLEQFNVFKRLGDNVRKNEYGKIGMYMLATYMFNYMHGKLTGGQMSANPLGAIEDSYEFATEDALKTSDKIIKISGRLAGETLSFIPFGNYIAGAGTFALGMDKKEREEYFQKEGDPVRYGNGPLIWNSFGKHLFEAGQAGLASAGIGEVDEDASIFGSLYDAALGAATPFGGKQIQKTTGGIEHLATKDPDPMIDPEWNGIPGAAKNLFFGKWAPNFKYEAELDEEMRRLYKENAALVASGDIEEAKAKLSILTEKTAPVYEKIMAEEKKVEVERLIKATEPLVRTLDALVKENKIDEAREIVSRLSKQETALVEAVRKKQKSEGYKREQEAELHPESKLREVIDYTYAFGTEFDQAWQMVFVEKEHIETTYGGMVTARRMTKDESEAWKKAAGAKKGEYLEHLLPLSLGGTNNDNNLKIVSGADHDSWTNMEVYLGNAVKYEAIPYVEAQELIMRFKGYAGEPISKEEIEKIVGRKFPSYKASDEEKEAGRERGLDDIGRNTLWLSDQDYSERKDEDGYKQGKRTVKHVVRDIFNKE